MNNIEGQVSSEPTDDGHRPSWECLSCGAKGLGDVVEKTPEQARSKAEALLATHLGEAHNTTLEDITLKVGVDYNELVGAEGSTAEPYGHMAFWQCSKCGAEGRGTMPHPKEEAAKKESIALRAKHMEDVHGVRSS